MKIYIQNSFARLSLIVIVTLLMIGMLVPTAPDRTAYGFNQDLDKLNRFVQTSAAASAAAAKAFREGRDLIEDENWVRAAERFNGFVSDYPKDKNADAALYWLAFALKKQSKFREADQKLERLTREFSGSSWTDDARAMRIEIAPQTGNSGVVADAITKDNEEIKIIALQSLFQGNSERASEYVNDILKPNSTAGRRLKETAVVLLAQHGGRAALPVLIDIARNGTDAKLRRTAIFWIGQSGDESAFDLLKELAGRAENEEVSKTALHAISQHGSARAGAYLSEVARTAQSPKVRREAIFWLSQKAGESAVDELMSIYGADQDIEVKKQVLFALSQIGGQRAEAKLLEVARTGDNVETRKQAIFWLGQRGGPQAIEMLIGLYDAEKSDQIKEQLLFVMGQSGQKPALRKLIEAARGDASVGIRKKAIFWLGQSRDPEAMKFLEDLLK